METQHNEENPERHTPGLAGRTTRTTTTSGGNFSRETGSVNDSPYFNIPAEMKELRQWVGFKLVPQPKGKKPKKVPINPANGIEAAVNRPKSWGTFADTVAAVTRFTLDGIGFVFTENDAYAGMDLDGCRDPPTGELKPWALDIVERLGSYTEASPSGTGLHIILKGKLPAGGGNNGTVEMYDTGRFFTFTGEHIGGTPTEIEAQQEEIEALYREQFPEKLKAKPIREAKPNGNAKANGNALSDEEVITLATGANNGAKVKALLAGELAGYPSASNAEMALCNQLAFYCGRDSEEQIDRMMRHHLTADRLKKWDEKHYSNGDTYGQRTVQKALEERTEFYTHPRTKAARGAGTHATDEAHAPIDLPELKVTANLTEMVDAAENALIQNFPKPVLYQRARIICRIAPAGEPPKWLQRPPDTPIIVRGDTISLREYSGQSGQWVKHDKRAKEWLPVLPPAVVFEALAARPAWKFPHLEGIIGAPTLRPDGVLVHKAGYDKETGLYLDLNGVQFPPVPDTPTREDAKAALDFLYEPFADFSFQDNCHRAAALAGVLTVVGRFTIPGSVPAFVARAHSKGSGKGLLVNTIATIGTGRTAPTWTQTLDEAEEGKRLLSIALAGDAVMHIDNITKPFGSAKLDSALTTATVKDRLLGMNINQEAPWITVVFASGNNMTFVGDMVRRIIPINLDPKVEHPEELSDFRHAPLLDWVRTERPRLVTAALTALKAFFHAGCPKQPNVSEFGSFEQWSNIIRHSLIWAGFPDPCGGRKHLEEESDTSYEALATLLRCWADCYPDTQARLTLKVITQDVERRQIPDPSTITPANEWNALHDALSAYDTKYDGKRLDTRRIGNALRTIEGRILDNQRLIRAGESKNVALWKRELLK